MNAESAKAERARVVLWWYAKKFFEKEGSRIARLEIKFELIVDALQEIRLPALLGMGRISVMGSIGQ